MRQSRCVGPPPRHHAVVLTSFCIRRCDKRFNAGKHATARPQRHPAPRPQTLSGPNQTPTTLGELCGLADHLAYTHDVAIKDSDWHVAPFGGEINTMLAPSEAEIQSLYEHLNVALVSGVVTQTVDQITAASKCPEISSRFSERAHLFIRLLHDQPFNVRRTLLQRFNVLTVMECEALRVKHVWSLGGNEFTSDARDATAFFDASGPTLYVRGPVTGSVWTEALRSTFHVLLPHAGGHDLPNLVFIGKHLLTAASVEAAEVELTDAGIPSLSDTWDTAELPPASGMLDGFSGVQDLTVIGTKEQASETPEEDPSSISRGESTPPEPMEGGADNATAGPGDVWVTGRTNASDDRRTTRTDTNQGPNTPRGEKGRSGNSESGFGSRPSAQSLGQRRSREAAATQRRNRLRSYVRPIDPDKPRFDVTAKSSNHVYDVEEAARFIVCNYEQTRGRTAEQMPPRHPGYDIKSYDRRGNVERLIEVKGIDGEWVEFGVGVKRRQFSEAWDEGERFWLYVVEFACDLEHARVHPIQNPAMKVDEFFFDQNWRGVAESVDDDLRAAFKTGAQIRHRAFGKGTIRARNERGHSVELTIDFVIGGVKPLALNLTQLELITEAEESDGDALS